MWPFRRRPKTLTPSEPEYYVNAIRPRSAKPGMAVELRFYTGHEVAGVVTEADETTLRVDATDGTHAWWRKSAIDTAYRVGSSR